MADDDLSFSAWRARLVPLDCRSLKGRKFVISYLDASGAETDRGIRVEALARDFENFYLDAFCYHRQAARTFSVDRIGEVIDWETGEVLGCGLDWLVSAGLVPEATRSNATDYRNPAGPKLAPEMMAPRPSSFKYTLVHPPVAEVILFPPPVLPPRDPRFVHRPVLCQLASSWRGTLPPGSWQAETEFVGVRVVWRQRRLWLKGGRHVNCTDALADELRTLESRFGCSMVFDGVLLPLGELTELCAAISRDARVTGTLQLFDGLPHQQWDRDTCTQPLWWRQRLLQAALQEWEPEHIRLATSIHISTLAQVTLLAEATWRTGGTGIVLKDQSSMYSLGRSKSWLKIKQKHLLR